MEAKTNAMRWLDKNKIQYQCVQYPHNNVALDGVTVAKLVGEDAQNVFKTLVTAGTSGVYYVFVVPVIHELDRKKAAKAVGEKSVEMLPVAKLLAVAGYVRGACSPIGMKKQFVTVLHASLADRPYVLVSGGRIGMQLRLRPADLLACCHSSYADIIKE